MTDIAHYLAHLKALEHEISTTDPELLGPTIAAAEDDLVRKIIAKPASTISEFATKLEALDHIALHVGSGVDGEVYALISSLREDIARLAA